MNARTMLLTVLALCVCPPAQAQSVLDSARAALTRRQFDSAHELVERAVHDSPDNAQAHYLSGEILGQWAASGSKLAAYGRARRSKASYARAVALEPDNPQYLAGLINYLYRAPGIVGGDRDSALILAARLETIDHRRGAVFLARIRWAGNTKDKALADSIIAALSTEASRPSRRSAGSFWASTGRDTRAVTVFDRLVAEDSLDLYARFMLGRSLVTVGKEPRRAQQLMAPLVEAPDSVRGGVGGLANIQWSLGQAYRQLGLVDSARLSFEAALRHQPDFGPAKRSLDSLRTR